jgi:hypothetical protein
LRACHSPYGITAKPESVSVSIGTPALCALRGFSQAISNFLRLGEIDDVARECERWRTALSDFNIDALVVEMVSVENEIDAGPSRSTPRGGGEADDAAPARSLGLADRGMLQPEAFVDLVVLDPDRVIDRATFEQPTTRRREDGATKHGDPPRERRILNKLGKF